MSDWTREDILEDIRFHNLVHKSVDYQRDTIMWDYNDGKFKCHYECKAADYKIGMNDVVMNAIVDRVYNEYKQREAERMMKEVQLMNIARCGNGLMHKFINVAAHCNGVVTHETVGPCEEAWLKISLEGTPMQISSELGKAFGSCGTIPEIVDVVNYNDRAVVVKFSDGSFTRSEAQDTDIFDLDTGIAICLFKRVLGGNGHKDFNDLIRHAHKVMNANQKKVEEEAHAKFVAEQKRKAKELKRKLKQKAKDDHDIFIQKQAYIQAMKETGMVLESSTEVTLEVDDGTKKKSSKKVKK